MADTEVVFDDAAVRKFLSGVTSRSEKISQKQHQDVIDIMGAVVFKDVIQHFEREEGPDGRWTGWSPSYAAFMASIGRSGNQILQFSGRLRNSFQPTNVRRTSDGLAWFNNAKTASGFPYAAAHNEGGARLPARKFMWLSDEALSSLEGQILKYLEG